MSLWNTEIEIETIASQLEKGTISIEEATERLKICANQVNDYRLMIGYRHRDNQSTVRNTGITSVDVKIIEGNRGSVYVKEKSHNP